jgi:hypothetical protein
MLHVHQADLLVCEDWVNRALFCLILCCHGKGSMLQTVNATGLLSIAFSGISSELSKLVVKMKICYPRLKYYS